MNSKIFFQAAATISIYVLSGCSYPFTHKCPRCHEDEAMIGTVCKKCGWTDPCIIEKCPHCNQQIRHLPGSPCQLCGKELHHA